MGYNTVDNLTDLLSGRPYRRKVVLIRIIPVQPILRTDPYHALLVFRNGIHSHAAQSAIHLKGGECLRFRIHTAQPKVSTNPQPVPAVHKNHGDIIIHQPLVIFCLEITEGFVCRIKARQAPAVGTQPKIAPFILRDTLHIIGTQSVRFPIGTVGNKPPPVRVPHAESPHIGTRPNPLFAITENTHDGIVRNRIRITRIVQVMCKPSALAVVEVQSPAIRGNPEIIILVGRNPHHMVIAKRIRLVVYFTVIGKAVGTGMDNAQPFVMHTHPEVPFFVLKQIMYLRVAHLLHKLIEHRMRRDRLLIRSETHHPQSVGPRPDSTLFILYGTESPPGRTPAERLRIGNKPLLFLIVHRHPHTDGGDQHIAVLLFI